MAQDTQADIDPARFVTRFASPRGFRQAYVHEGVGGVPLVCVHGWPETKRIFWRVVEPLAEAGFEVIVPDLRGFGESELGPDGFHDVPAHSHDLFALVHDHLGHDEVVLVGGDLGGPVVQDLALRHPDWVARMVLFNSPLPYVKGRMAGLRTRPAAEAPTTSCARAPMPTRLAAEPTRPSNGGATSPRSTGAASGLIRGPSQERSTSTPNRSRDGGVAAGQLRRLRERLRSRRRRASRRCCARNERTPTLILFGPADHVLYPDFDRMAAAVFDQHVGPFLLRDCGHFVPWEAPHTLVSGVRMMAADLLAARRSGPLSRS